MSEKLYNVKQCLRNNGVALTIIIYYRKVLNKVYNYLVLGRLDTNIDSRANLLGLKYIKLGENFSAGRGLWLEAVTRYNGKNTIPKLLLETMFPSANITILEQYLILKLGIMFFWEVDVI